MNRGEKAADHMSSTLVCTLIKSLKYPGVFHLGGYVRRNKEKFMLMPSL